MFSGIVDYAGMFPPAQLSLEQAIRNYARYRTEPESWMLGRFVCPVGLLSALRPIVPTFFPPDSEVLVSTVAGGYSSSADIRAVFPGEFQISGARVDSIEWSVAPEALDSIARGRFTNAAPGSEQKTACAPPESPPVYFEIPPGPNWSSDLKHLVDGLEKTGDQRWRVKLRCGGAVIPSCDELAATITLCRDGRVPLKFTAGLHHPIRHHDPTLGIRLHGFLNVFGAGVLAHAHNLSQAQLRSILEDQDAGHFEFDADCFRWTNWRASVAQIEATRRQLVLSFGSCSFDEPREGLRELGLIP
jgi:hypothetical protein